VEDGTELLRLEYLRGGVCGRGIAAGELFEGDEVGPLMSEGRKDGVGGGGVGLGDGWIAD